MIKELLRRKIPIFVVANYHVLLEVGDLAFVSDIWPRERIVARDHHTRNICTFQVLNRIVSLLFQLILKNFKPVEFQITLNLMPLNVFWVTTNFFRSDCKDSKPSWCILLQNLMIVVWYWIFAHDLVHDFRRSLTVAEETLTHHRVRSNYAHPLHIGIKLKPSENDSLVISLACKGENHVGVVLGKVKLKLSEFEQLYFHRVSNKLSRAFYLNDRMVRCHISQSWSDVRLLRQYVLNFWFFYILLLFSWDNQREKLSLTARDESVEIHEVFSESSCFIEAGVFDSTSCYDFIGRDAKDLFIFEFFKSENDAESHTDG